MLPVTFKHYDQITQMQFMKREKVSQIFTSFSQKHLNCWRIPFPLGVVEGLRSSHEITVQTQ